MENICDYMFDKFENGKTKDIIVNSDEMLCQIASNVIVEGFLGSDFKEQKIEDLTASQYLVNLTTDINRQMI